MVLVRLTGLELMVTSLNTTLVADSKELADWGVFQARSFRSHGSQNAMYR